MFPYDGVVALRSETRGPDKPALTLAFELLTGAFTWRHRGVGVGGEVWGVSGE